MCVCVRVFACVCVCVRERERTCAVRADTLDPPWMTRGHIDQQPHKLTGSFTRSTASHAAMALMIHMHADDGILTAPQCQQEHCNADPQPTALDDVHAGAAQDAVVRLAVWRGGKREARKIISLEEGEGDSSVSPTPTHMHTTTVPTLWVPPGVLHAVVVFLT